MGSTSIAAAFVKAVILSAYRRVKESEWSGIAPTNLCRDTDRDLNAIVGKDEGGVCCGELY